MALSVAHACQRRMRGPLTLSGALPFVDGSCGVHDDGVRTFLPSGALASDEPAIARLTRYGSIIAGPHGDRGLHSRDEAFAAAPA